MLQLLSATWPGGAALSFLHVHAEPLSFAIGYFAALAASVLTLYWAMRVLGRLSPRALLGGETTATSVLPDAGPRSRFGMPDSRWVLAAAVLGALAAIVAGMVLPSSYAAGCFFVSGALLLTACLAAVQYGLKRWRGDSSPEPTLTRLGIRNASRNAVRSVLTVGLLAAASFVIVAVEAFHQEADEHFASKTGGSGGFALYAEGAAPIYEDLNDVLIRRRYDLYTKDMPRVECFYACRVQPGDDASCLNLFKPLRPRVMGVPNRLIQRGGFGFSASLAETPEEKANPWLLLLKEKTDNALPAIIDATTAEHILKVSLGETIDVPNDRGEPVKLRIVALLRESIFQSEILVSDATFLSLYPRQTGFSFILIDTSPAEPSTLPALEQEFNDRLGKMGLEVQTTASRLQGYLNVENTYLFTFQMLGGLGLVLGAAGLAIVLLRGVWERRAELALLQALGFRRSELAWLVLVENAFLLILGLAAGTASALLAVAPHLFGTGSHVLWLHIAILLLIVLSVGLLSTALAVASTLRTPVLTALRRE
jgi:hypothetical protein